MVPREEHGGSWRLTHAWDMVWPEAGEGRAVRATFGLLGPGEAIVPSSRSDREVAVFSLHGLELDSIRWSAKSFCWISNLAQRTHPNGSREEWLAGCHIDHWLQLHLLELCPDQMSPGCCLQSSCSHSPFPPRHVIGFPQSLPRAQYQTASDSCLFLGPPWKPNFLDTGYKTGSAPKDIFPILSDYVFHFYR